MLAAFVAMLTIGLVAGPVVAGKGGGGGSQTGAKLDLVLVDPGDTVANWGDQVTFVVTSTSDRPVVSVTCSQGGTVVYGDSRPMYWPNIWDDPGIFTLRSLAWDGGAADCRADLKVQSRRKISTVATLSFHVEA